MRKKFLTATITTVLSILLFTIIMNLKYSNIATFGNFLYFLIIYTIPIWIILLTFIEIVDRIRFLELLLKNQLNLIISFLIILCIITFPIEIYGQENDYNLSLILTATIWLSLIIIFKIFNKIKFKADN